MDYKELLKDYMVNVVQMSAEMTKELYGEDAGGDFLGSRSQKYLTPEQFEALMEISDENAALGLFAREDD